MTINITINKRSVIKGALSEEWFLASKKREIAARQHSCQPQLAASWEALYVPWERPALPQLPVCSVPAPTPAQSCREFPPQCQKLG